MSDHDPKKTGRPKRPSKFLAADALLDSILYEMRNTFTNVWEWLSIQSGKLRLHGFRRLLLELTDEAFSMGVAGLVVLLALALPAFEETRKDWRNQTDISVTFLDRFGNQIGQRGILQKAGVPLDSLPDYVIKAVLATEDRRFFEHYGIDFLGLTRALSENVRANGVVQGGSTLTQQLAKNLFLTNERTIQRKIKEAFLSIWLEANLSKKEILQLYLDRAYMGGGTFGIRAASEFYFDKDVSQVSLAEAAMLSGLFKAPAKYAPHLNLPAARGRANEVLTNMVQAGFLTEGQVISARRNPATPVDRAAAKSPDYFLDWAYEEVQTVAKRLPQKSLVVQTTIDTDLQAAAEEAAEFHLRQFGEQYNVSQSAIVMMDTEGAVRAIVGGRDYGTSQFNRATKALRQAGSSFKPYVYATAMENGYTPDSVVADAPISWGTWSPQNYARSYSGKVTLTTALAKSINTIPVRLAMQLKTDKIAALAHDMGVDSEISLHKTMSLGTSGMTVLDQATGYLTMADGGEAGKRHAFTRITSHDGKILWSWEKDGPKPHRALSVQAANNMNIMLSAVPESGTGRRAALPGIRVAGKTGTTQSYRDAWFVGFTGNYVAAVWFGNDDYSPSNEMTGGILPAMTWQRLMAYAHQNIALKPIPGLKEPFLPQVEENGIAATEPANGDNDKQRIRPVILSSESEAALFELRDQFRDAPLLAAPEIQTTSSVGH